MTTKAQEFRNAQTRAAMLAKPKAAPKRRPRREDDIDTSLPGVSATDRKRVRRPDARSHAGKRGGAVLEPVAAGARPSRKSTRKSADHVKQSTNLQLKASRASAAPTTRATRGAAARTAKGGGRAAAPRATPRGSSSR